MSLSRIQTLHRLLPIAVSFDKIKGDFKVDYHAESRSERENVEIKLGAAIDPKTRKNIEYSVLISEPKVSTEPLEAFLVGFEVDTHESFLSVWSPASNLLDDVRSITAEIAIKLSNVAMCAQMVESLYL